MSEISIESVSKRFEEHINIDKNYRIIFSGKFGIGKTYFVNNFFEQRKAKFNKFLISPVNYVVSSNEDIFELIKADIIKDLFLTGKINLKKLPEDTTLQKISGFIESKKSVIGKFMLNSLAKLNSISPAPETTIKALGEIYKDYKKYSTTKKSEDKTRSEELTEYWFETNEKIGHIYEHNYITKVIDSFLSELKENGKKKNVLIIDDLDRIDPEHIFRILNVFSAHNNQFDSENKFKFDHIIIVCDIENIKRIFYHKYGNKVDFDGYADKFFSTDIFYFLNQEAIKNYVISTFGTGENKNQQDFLVLILQILVDQDLLSVRKLLKHNFNIYYEEFLLYEQGRPKERDLHMLSGPYFSDISKRHYINSSDLSILRFFKLMCFIFGSFDSFWEVLAKLKGVTKTIDYFNSKNLILFLSLQEHIACKNGDDLFFDKIKASVAPDYVGRLEWPRISNRFGRFRINLKWTNGNLYDSMSSYFKDAFAVDVDESQYPDSRNTKEFKLSDIIITLEKIILSCHEKGYLQKAGILWNKID